ncbi:MAG: thioesterase family protein [Myxococcota bacterium]
MRYSRPMRVRFGHADPAGIVYYPRFFEWFHDAFEAMFEAVTGRPYAEILQGTRAGFPAVSLATEFKAPARFGELVEVEVFLSRLSERSGTFEYRVRRMGALLATASVKVSVIDLDTMRSRPWPPELRAQFEPYVEEDAERPDGSRLRA